MSSERKMLSRWHGEEAVRNTTSPNLPLKRSTETWLKGFSHFTEAPFASIEQGLWEANKEPNPFELESNCIFSSSLQTVTHSRSKINLFKSEISKFFVFFSCSFLKGNFILLICIHNDSVLTPMTTHTYESRNGKSQKIFLPKNQSENIKELLVLLIHYSSRSFGLNRRLWTVCQIFFLLFSINNFFRTFSHFTSHSKTNDTYRTAWNSSTQNVPSSASNAIEANIAVSSKVHLRSCRKNYHGFCADLSCHPRRLQLTPPSQIFIQIHEKGVNFNIFTINLFNYRASRGINKKIFFKTTTKQVIYFEKH